MKKWADYLISNVERDSYGNILNILLYIDNGDDISKIGIKTKNDVIILLKQGYSIKTILWAYPNWKEGAEVHYVRDSSGEYLRTNRTETEEDNLDNLIPIQ